MKRYQLKKIVKWNDKGSFSYSLNRLLDEGEASFKSYTIKLSIPVTF